MAPSRIWTMYAYKSGDADQDEVRVGVPEWRVEDAFRWARHRGYEGVYFYLTGDTDEYVKPPPSGTEATLRL